MKPLPGDNRSLDLHIRPYDHQKDAEAILKLQADSNSKWAEFEPNVLHPPGLPQNPIGALVMERDGKIVALVGSRVVLEVGCRIDPDGFDDAYQFRDMILEMWAKCIAESKRSGFDRMVCSVTSPTPKWKNFLKKRLGFGGYGAEMLHLNLGDL